MNGYKKVRQFYLFTSKDKACFIMSRRTSRSSLQVTPLKSKIEKKDWSVLTKIKPGIIPEKETSEHYFRSIIIALLNGHSCKSDEELQEKFNESKKLYPNWLNIAEELAMKLFPTLSVEERKAVINSKLLISTHIAKMC